MIQMLQRIAMLSTMLITFLSAFAYDFEQDGIYYKITSEEYRSVAVTGDSYGDDKYSGDIEIPKRLIYNNKTYTVTSISEWAFSSCSGLTSVTIPNSVTSIGENAFLGCSGLTSVTIPNSVTSVGVGAFSKCDNLDAINVHSGNPTFCSHDGILYNKEMTTLRCCPGKKISVSIPNSVTSIFEKAFYGCSGLTSVNIPNSVTSIGAQAFSGCSGLTSVNIGNSVTSIGANAFRDCSGLTSVTIPNSVTSIGAQAFSGCSGLTSVSIPNSVTSIGEYAFYRCHSLTSVTIPNSVTSIGYAAFYGCHSLTSVTIPNSVTSIGEFAFSGCSGLASISIGNSVTSIGRSAFYGCSGLTSISIGNSVTSIGRSAFSRCSGLEAIYSQIVEPFECEPGFSDDNLKNTILYVPTGTLSAYEKGDPWRNFWNIEEIDYSGVQGVEPDVDSKTEVGRYNLQGLEVDSDHTGLIVIKYSDGTYCKQFAK